MNFIYLSGNKAAAPLLEILFLIFFNVCEIVHDKIQFFTYITRKNIWERACIWI
jgi:hypothetical protein